MTTILSHFSRQHPASTDGKHATNAYPAHGVLVARRSTCSGVERPNYAFFATGLVFAFMMLFATELLAQEQSQSFYVGNSETRTLIPGATVLYNSGGGTYSNSSGVVRVSLPVPDSVVIRSLGMQTITVAFPASADTVWLTPSITQSEAVVVTAGRREQALEESSVPVELVQAKELQEKAITELDDALRYVPGVTIARDQINVRGSSGFSLGLGSRVLVLLDNAPLIAGDGGDVKFDAIPFAALESMEVVKSAGSSLWGGSALGGVVNVRTQDPFRVPNMIALSVNNGYYTLPHEEWQYTESMPSFGGVELAATHVYENLGILAAGSYNANKGYHEFGGSERFTGFLKSSYRLNDYSTLHASLMYAEQHKDNWVFWRSLKHATLPPEGIRVDDRLLSTKLHADVSLTSVLSSDQWLSVRASMFRTHYENTGPSSGNDSIASTANSVFIDVQHTLAATDDIMFSQGLSARLNHVPESYLGAVSQSILAGWIQAELELSPTVRLSGGLRLDGESSEDRNTEFVLSPHVGANIMVSDAWRLRANVGTGFRAPSLGERFSSLRYGNFIIAANPDLTAEHSVTSEIGWHFEPRSTQHSTWFVDGALFYNFFYDIIEPGFSDSGTEIYFDNLQDATIAGVEISTGYMHTDGEISASVTLLKAEDKEGNALKYRTPLLVQVHGELQVIEDLSLSADYRFQKKFERIDDELVLFIPDANVRVDAHVVDVTCSWSFSEGTNISLIGRNILNHYYTEIMGTLAPTRSVVLRGSVVLGY